MADIETEEVPDIVVVQPKEPVKAEEEAKKKRKEEYKWENDKVEALINRWELSQLLLDTNDLDTYFRKDGREKKLKGISDTWECQ